MRGAERNVQQCKVLNSQFYFWYSTVRTAVN